MTNRKKNKVKEVSQHNYYLNNLVNNLSKIGERPYEIAWIMKDGIWMPRGTTKRNKLCDLILVYYNRLGVPIELKGSTKKKRGALMQIKSGKKFLEEVIGVYVPYGRFITYKNGKFTNEKIMFK